MARKKTDNASERDLHPTALRTVNLEGEAPGHRLRSAQQAWEIAEQLDRDDSKRQKKRTRVFKCYNRFPPGEYSLLFKQGGNWQSNVGFGMMAFVVDNNLSSFFDMVTERVTAAEIITKHGNPRERADYSEHISLAFDEVLREWDGYLINVEQFTLDMLLYGKGIETWEDEEGCTSEHIPADDLLVSDDTKIDLSNWDVIVVKRRYTLIELFKKIRSQDAARQRGWNVEAVINAMRMQRETWRKKSLETYAKDIANGNITVAGHLKEKVPCYVVYIREFNDKVSKHIVLQEYAPIVNDRTKGGNPPQGFSVDDWKKKAIDEEGFLYTKPDYAEDIHEVFSIFMDCAGGGVWHHVPSLAEKIFVQCRQYDFVMNGIMDAVKMNMSLMLQAQTPDAAKKIKELVFGPYVFIPSEVPFIQQRLQLDTVGATQSVQFMMADMYRGIGEYRIQEKAKGGGQMTATERQLDAAESAKLTGTQLKRYNGQFSIYYRKLYKRLVNMNSQDRDYKYLKKFKECLEEYGVPKEAWAWDNIKSIKSNMLAGAGSPSYKLMAAEKTLAITNITPKDEGQRKAQEDAIAALHGRQNVSRYLSKMNPDPTWNERMALWENGVLSDVALNPTSAQVYPNDNHSYHISVHLADMEQTLTIVNDKMKQGNISESYAEQVAHKLLNQGGHVNAHLRFLQRDETKEDDLKNAAARLNVIQRAADKLAQQMQEMKNAKGEDFDVAKDPEIQKKIAMGQIEVDLKQKLANIKIGANAASHAQRQEIDKEKAANQMAIERAKGKQQIRQKRVEGAISAEQKAKTPTPKKK